MKFITSIVKFLRNAFTKVIGKLFSQVMLKAEVVEVD